MFCKYGDGDYVPYDTVVAEDRLADVVDIRFYGLKKTGFQTTVSKVNWKAMPNVKKIEGVNTDFIDYIFPKGALPQLEEVVFTNSNLSPGTLKSLLDAVPNIDSEDRAGNFKFTWDMLSSISPLELGNKVEDDVFLTQFERVEKIQAAQKIHGQYSGETTVPDEDLDEEIYSGTGEYEQFKTNPRDLSSLYSDSDTNTVVSSESGTSNGDKLVGRVISHTTENDDALSEYNFELDEGEDYDSYYSSETGDSHSDSELLEGGFVPKASERNSTLSEEEARRLDTLYHSGLKPKKTDMQSDGDNESSVGSFQVIRLSKQQDTEPQDDNASVSTLSEDLDRELNDLTFEELGVASWEDSPVTQISCRLEGDKSLYDYSSLEESQRKNIVEMTITGSGPETNVLALLTQNEWNALTQLKVLKISNASITTKYLGTTAPKITLSNLTSLELRWCGIDYKGLKCLVGNSTKSDVKYNGELQKVAMFGSDYAWTAFPSGDNDLAQIKEEFSPVEWQDMAVPDDLLDIGDFNLNYSEEDLEEFLNSSTSTPFSRTKIPYPVSKRGPNRSSLERAPLLMQAVTSDSVKKIEFTLRQDSSSSINFVHNLTLKQFEKLSRETKQDIQTMTIIGGGSGSSNVVSAIDWSNLSGLESLTISNATVIGSLDDSIQFDNLTYILFENCGVDDETLKSFSKASDSLESLNIGSLNGVGMDDVTWRILKSGEIDSIQTTIQAVLDSHSYDADADSSIHRSQFDDFEFDEEAGKKSGLRAGGKQRTTHDLEDRSRSAAGVEVLVTYHPSTSVNSSLSIDIHLTQEEFNNLSESERAQIKTLVITGNGQDGPDVGYTIDWSGLSRLEGLRLKRVTVDQPLPEAISFDSLKSIYFENCGVDSSAFESFSTASTKLEEMDAKDLYGLSIGDNSWRDLYESEKELIRDTLESVNIYYIDFDLSIQQKVNHRRSSPMISGELEDDDSELGSLSEGESPRSTVPLPLPLSPSFTRNLKTAQPEILCYFSGESDPIPYTQIGQRALGNIVGVFYAGLGHADDAMTKLPWAELTGLRNLYISNALVASDEPFQRQGKKILFPNLVEMTFSKCKLGSKALGGFVNRASTDLTKLEISRDCDIGLPREITEIAQLKSKVNNRSREADFSRSPDTDRGNTLNPHRREDNVGAGAGVGAGNDPRVFTSRHKSKVNPDGTTTHTSTLLPNQPPGQQRGHLSSHRRSSSLGNGNGRTSDGSSMLGGVSGRKNESRVDTGVGGNTITNMHVPSRASLYGGKSRYQSRNQSGFPESTGPARSIPVTQFKTRMYRPEIVVENGAAVRDYQKLVEDATDALHIIQQVNPDVKDNYLLFELAASETINIAYRGEDHKITSILDASIDTVRVHRGWRQVDKNISNEDRAEIIIASLGIPPCPPDIAISKEHTPLGQAIRAEFNRLKRDEPEITVSAIR